jgi:hypothetical protein
VRLSNHTNIGKIELGFAISSPNGKDWDIFSVEPVGTNSCRLKHETRETLPPDMMSVNIAKQHAPEKKAVVDLVHEISLDTWGLGHPSHEIMRKIFDAMDDEVLFFEEEYQGALAALKQMVPEQTMPRIGNLQKARTC